MKIKYKLILIFIILIITVSIPISFYILDQEAKAKITLLSHQVNTNGRIMAKSMLNILLMNGGDISQSRIDAKEMISILNPLQKDGLVYADVILISPKAKYNGVILTKFINKDIEKTFKNNIQQISEEEIERLQKVKDFHEIKINSIKEICYENVSIASIKNIKVKCIGRLIYSKERILSSIEKFKNLVYGATLTGILFVSILGVFFSRIISKPIDNLTKGVAIIGSGDFDYRIPIKHKDELGKLGQTINHLVQMVNLERTELISINEDLKRIDRLKDEFLANMTHELKTPLYGIIGLAESLYDGVSGELNKSTLYNLSLIITSGKRLSTLVNDILDFSLLKHGGIDLKYTTVDLYSVVVLIISITRPLIKEKNINIYTSIEPELYYINVDENRLQQILLNIVGNAVKFTEEGEIEISAELNKNNNNEVIISVRDTGPGIPKDKHDNVFESFEQVDGSISRTYGGSGLGLAITKHLVELHNGKIWIDSETEKGSKFHFTIQKSKQTKETIKQVEKEKELKKENENTYPFVEKENKILVPRSVNNRFIRSKIFVVDDEPVNCQVLVNHLAMEGYDITTITSGFALLRMIDEGNIPDLILLDVMLPKISGYEVCKKIRETYSQSELPILMLTAKNTVSDLVTGYEVGTNDYLTKPINKQILLARVTSLISLKRSIEEHNELNVLKREIKIAHQIQDSLLEAEIPKTNNFEFAVQYKPMYELGGDYYEINVIDDNHFDVLIADVSGHGIPAAFISAMLKVTISFCRESINDPATLIENINTIMYNFTHDQFVTLAYARIDLHNMKLYQTSAGHWPILIHRKDDNEIVYDKVSSIPIGWKIDEEYETYETDIKINDRIILYTDGIVETRDKDNKMYGEERFHDFIKNNIKLNVDKFSDKVIQSIIKWSEISDEESFEDDVTLIVVDIFDNEVNS